MTAKEYLSQAKRLRIKIEQKKRILAEIKAKMVGRGSLDVKGEKVQSAPDAKSRVEESVVKFVDLEIRIEEDIRRYYEKCNEIIDTIHSLNDSRYILILHAKWIDGESLERIAADTGYSFGHVSNMYWKAMRRMQQTIDEMEK